MMRTSHVIPTKKVFTLRHWTGETSYPILIETKSFFLQNEPELFTYLHVLVLPIEANLKSYPPFFKTIALFV